VRVFYTTKNCGDGSAVVRFFESQACIDALEEHDPEGYGMGEGGSSFWVEGTISVKIATLKDVQNDIGATDEEMMAYANDD
jgi:hypothetical protein